MKKHFRVWVAFLLSAAVLTGVSFAEEFDDENYYKILSNNIEKKSVWLNPGQFISDEIDPEYATLSDEIVEGAVNDLEKLDKIYEWVTSNIYYDYDRTFGYLTPTEEERAAGKTTALQLRRGVCETYASILKQLLNAQNIPCFVIHGKACNTSTAIPLVDTTNRSITYIGVWTDNDVTSSSTDHAWNAVFVDGRWVEVDATWDSGNRYVDGNYVSGSAMRGYYDAGDWIMAYSHKIVTYPKASQDDTPDTWAQDEISSAINAYIVPYDLQRDYRTPITRVEFCNLAMTLWNHISGDSLDDQLNCPFSDTQDDSVTQAYYLGIVNGVGNDQFDPEKKISRQEAATMLMRFGKLVELRDAENYPASFSDQADVANWGIEGVNYVRTKGLMAGTGSGFSPNGTYTVQEAILTFARLNERIDGTGT